MILGFYLEMVFDPCINLGLEIRSILSGQQSIKMCLLIRWRCLWVVLAVGILMRFEAITV